MERDVLTEQRNNIKFIVKLGKSGREILDMLETVYGESAMKRRTVYKWVDRFKEGREGVDDNAREGRPSTSRVAENIQRVHDLVKSDRRITTRIITDMLAISKGSVETILKEDLNVNCGQKRTGSFITTIHPRTRRELCFAKNDMITTDQHSYSPVLAPATYFVS
jgi:transposase